MKLCSHTIRWPETKKKYPDFVDSYLMCCTSSLLFFLIFVYSFGSFLSFAFNFFICLSFSLYFGKTSDQGTLSMCLCTCGLIHFFFLRSISSRLGITHILLYIPYRNKVSEIFTKGMENWRMRARKKSVHFYLSPSSHWFGKSFILYFDSMNRMSKCLNGVISWKRIG